MDEISRVTDSAGHLAIEPRGPRWAHTALCVLDAVFSINAHYERHTVPTCYRYVTWAGLSDPLVSSAHLPVLDEQPLGDFVTHVQIEGEVAFSAQVLQNKQRTRANLTAPLKVEAARRYAEILVANGIETLANANALLVDSNRLKLVEQAMASVAGHGSGARLSYLWMLLGDDGLIKPDRMVLGWLRVVLQRTVTSSDAIRLLTEAAARLGCKPWELDHAIWTHQRNP
ncbi:hypothetical protein OG698_29705 [Streptomyces sp. NBC_01003]|uniref:hypothetical protein n=1 Tax=Streptomyces sp. NBC_01003 TaxID=2903714 RepID=UPI003866A330|nr:hypothetical protein OG698_29705 [Streptomyces sp. NBC_01003]